MDLITGLNKTAGNIASSAYLKISPYVTAAPKLASDTAELRKPWEIINSKLQEIYGIESDIQDKNLLTEIYESIKDFCKLNEDDSLFKGLKLCTADMGKGFFKTDIDYTNNKFIVTYNKNADIWKNIEKITEEQYNLGNFASANPRYIHYLSLGDYLNFSYNPYAYKVCKNRFYIDDAAKKTARICPTIVEYYANGNERPATNIDEFCRHYIASKMSGVNVPKELDTYFFEACANSNLKFPKVSEKFIEGTKFSFKTIEEAEKYLEQYGITAKFSDINQANSAVEAVEDLIQATDKKDIFQGLQIKIDPDIYSNTGTVATTHTSYNWDNNQANAYITINPAFNWKNLSKTRQLNYDNGFRSTNRAKGEFIHELAHYIDFIGNPKRYATTHSAFQNGSYYNHNGINWASKISSYASKNPAEFCAEYVEGRMAGITYPNCTNNEFLNKWNGIKINFPKSV